MQQQMSEVVKAILGSVTPSSSPVDSAASSDEWVSPFRRFDTTVHPQAEVAQQATRDWVYAISTGQPRGLVLWSNGYGCGKTYLARLAEETLRVMLDKDGRRQRVSFLTAPDFFQDIKDCYAKDDPVAPLFNEWCRGHFILDDWGKQYVTDGGSEWSREQFFRLIDRLYERHGFLMTSNTRPDLIERQIGGAAWSRLLGMCGPEGVVDMSDVPDFRLTKAGF